MAAQEPVLQSLDILAVYIFYQTLRFFTVVISIWISPVPARILCVLRASRGGNEELHCRLIRSIKSRYFFLLLK